MDQEFPQKAVKSGVANDPGAVTFRCPCCNETEIHRSAHNRKTAARYKCPKCGFEGPN